MRYRRRAWTVQAYLWDGENQAELAEVLAEHHPGARFDPSSCAPGEVYLVLGPAGSWWVEMVSAFEAAYEPVEAPSERVEPQYPRTCYECLHYALTPASGGFCTLFSERVDSEIAAAANCLGYERPHPTGRAL